MMESLTFPSGADIFHARTERVRETVVGRRAAVVRYQYTYRPVSSTVNVRGLILFGYRMLRID